VPVASRFERGTLAVKLVFVAPRADDRLLPDLIAAFGLVVRRAL